MTVEHLEDLRIGELRARAKELGVELKTTMTKKQIAAAIEAASVPMDGDGPPLPDHLVPAPDDEGELFTDDAAAANVEEAERQVADDHRRTAESAKPVPPSEAKASSLTAEQVADAINGGDSGGLPSDPKQRAVAADGTVVIARERHPVSAMIAGFGVKVVIETTTRIVEWELKPRGEEDQGKLRLMNDVELVMFGQQVKLRAGKEFWPHQVDQRAVTTAGGVLIPIR